MKKIKCYFGDVNDVKDFTKSITELECNVDANYENQVVDAKSLLGVFSLFNHELDIVLHSDDEDMIRKFECICKKFEVR